MLLVNQLQLGYRLKVKVALVVPGGFFKKDYYLFFCYVMNKNLREALEPTGS